MTNIKKSIGDWGESTACQYLENKGYNIIDRNFLRKWGEIDIIATVPRFHQDFGGQARENRKSVLRGTGQRTDSRVPRGTLLSRVKDFFRGLRTNVHKVGKENSERTIVFVEVKTLHKGMLRPEDNITQAKIRRLIRSCQLYLSEKNHNLDETDWQIDTIGIVVDKQTGKFEIEHLKQAVYL